MTQTKLAAMSFDEMVTVILAAKAGKDIQFQETLNPEPWQAIRNNGHVFNFARFRYRVNPQPTTIWVNEFPDKVFFAYDDESEAREHGYKAQRVAVKYTEEIEA